MPSVTLTVNGRQVEAAVESRTHLGDFLRDRLLLTGTHLGCEHGVCGACTVFVDGEPTRSCIAFVAGCEGSEIRTIESFDEDPLMAELRTAFSKHHALQCGYCTPGMLATAYDIVRRLPNADEARIKEELAGNLCRCTGYVGIVEAIRSVLRDGAPRGDVRAKVKVAAQGAAQALPKAGVQSAVSSSESPSSSSTVSDSGTALQRNLRMAVPLDDLWSTLRDIEATVRCLPGAELTSSATREPFGIRMSAAIGPMRATFVGEARVEYDDARHTGRLDGTGRDASTRSSAEGRIEFRAHDAGGGGSELELSIRYALKGPLAQFSRGAVVEAVVDQLLDRFVENLSKVASGKEIAEEERVGGLRVLLAALWKRITSR